MNKFSIVTVCYNSESTISKTLLSVSSQKYPLIEHIIVDGASQDRTVSIVRAHVPGVSNLVSERDEGIYDAMNKGFNLSTGDFIGYLNSDDSYIDSDVLSEVVEKFSDPKVDFVYGDLRMVNSAGDTVRLWSVGSISDSGLIGSQIPHPTFFVRREKLMMLSPAFDSSYKIAADLKQQLILLNKMKLKGAYIRRVLVDMSIGGASTAGLRSYAAGWKESVRAYNEVFGKGGFLFTAAKVFSKIKGIRKLK